MGHPVLRAKAQAISRGDIKSAVVQQLIDDMLDTMIEYHGVGLAAPQVHEGLRIFVARARAGHGAGDEESPVEPIAIINPEITPVGDELVEDWEGCLSIPDIRGRVPRAREIRAARATIATATNRTATCTDFPRPCRPARNRSSRRHPVFRSDAVVRVADLPRRVLALLGQGLERALATA